MKTIHDIEKPSLEEALEHYGVKGMKWGVRRTQAQLDRAAGRVKKAGKAVGRAAAKSAKQQVDFYKDPRTKKALKDGATFAASIMATIVIANAADNVRSAKNTARVNAQEKSRIETQYKKQIAAAMSNHSRTGKGSDWIDSEEGKMFLWNTHRNWDEKSRARGLGGLDR